MGESDPIRQLIADAMHAKGLSAAEVSTRLGKNAAYIQQFLKRGVPRRLPEDVRRPLAALLGLKETELGAPEAVIAPSQLFVRGERDLPVYASAMGGPGEMIYFHEPIDFEPRPDRLLTVRDAFAMYIVGDSMSPAFEQGDLALINPHLPTRPGDDVLVTQQQDETEVAAMVKRLVRETHSDWQLRQFNPVKTFSVKKSEWPKALRIIGKYSRR